jgi:Xaa-Pro dipeptidase
MEEQRWDLFVTSDYRTVYYFSGLLGSKDFPTLFLQYADGKSGLISSSKGAPCCDDVTQLETYSIGRSIDFPSHDAAVLLRELLMRYQSTSIKHCALERGAVPGLFEQTLRDSNPDMELLDASRALLDLRKKKEEDEVQSIRESLRYCGVAYRAAQEILAPGLTEIDVYNAMHDAVMSAAGTTISFAGDFACGERGISEGGPPTLRKVRSGDLYILDIFPAVDLYNGDTTRTFALSEPTDLQQRGWEIVMQAVRLAEGLIKPGVSARSVYLQVKGFLDSFALCEQSFWHHLGHGLGHRGHDSPRIIPGSDDIFEEGDVFTIEPGIYTKALQGGIRLEDNYVLRQTGLEDLFDLPWEL